MHTFIVPSHIQDNNKTSQQMESCTKTDLCTLLYLLLTLTCFSCSIETAWDTAKFLYKLTISIYLFSFSSFKGFHFFAFLVESHRFSAIFPEAANVTYGKYPHFTNVNSSIRRIQPCHDLRRCTAVFCL